MIAALVTLSPVSSAAATITVSIGSFTWDQFLGERFTLQNDSASFIGLASDFTDVSVVLIPDYDLDGVAGPDDPISDFDATVGSLADGNSFTQTYDGPFTSVRLQFRFTPAGLPELVFDRSFDSPDDPFFSSPFINYSYDVTGSDPGGEPVPEPSTLLLLGSALAVAALKKRLAQARSPFVDR
jgi:hypothetical protein